MYAARTTRLGLLILLMSLLLSLAQGANAQSPLQRSSPSAPSLCIPIGFSNTSYAVDNSPFTLLGNYFNDDGVIDLATANYSSDNVSVLLGTGSGTFQTALNSNAGSAPRSPALASISVSLGLASC